MAGSHCNNPPLRSPGAAVPEATLPEISDFLEAETASPGNVLRCSSHRPDRYAVDLGESAAACQQGPTEFILAQSCLQPYGQAAVSLEVQPAVILPGLARVLSSGHWLTECCSLCLLKLPCMLPGLSSFLFCSIAFKSQLYNLLCRCLSDD